MFLCMKKIVDDVVLHGLLWGRRDRLNRVVVHQSKLALELGVDQSTVSVAVRRLVDGGALKKISAAQGNIVTFSVRDPSMFL